MKLYLPKQVEGPTWLTDHSFLTPALSDCKDLVLKNLATVKSNCRIRKDGDRKEEEEEAVNNYSCFKNRDNLTHLDLWPGYTKDKNPSVSNFLNKFSKASVGL